MGRWVTSKGRRIYIPDEGEENPYAKGKTYKNHMGARIKVLDSDGKNVTYRITSNKDDNLDTVSSTSQDKTVSKEGFKAMTEKNGYKSQQSKDEEIKEKQITSNKKDKDYDIRKSEHGVFVAHSSAEGKKKGVKDLEKRFDNEKEAKAWIKSQKKIDKEASKIRLVSKEEMDEKIKQAQIKENKKQADTRNGKNNYSNKSLSQLKEKTSKPVSLVSKSSGSLKTMYKNASTEEERKRILAELNSRGFYSKNGKWTSKGGGR